jgi:hypothetical protein
MSIRLSDYDVSFDDDALRAMGKAYDHACDALGCFGIAVTVREMVAKRIVEVAGKGEHNPTRFYQEALRTLERRQSQPTGRSVGQVPQPCALITRTA